MDTTEQATIAADPYKDHEAIKALVARKREEWGRGRENITRPAYRNILFYRGHQWIIWDRGLNRFRPPQLPKGTPTPVTNRFASTLDAVMSVFARVEPHLNFAPGSPDEPDDRAAADVASRAIEVIEDECNIRLNRQTLAVWNGMTGTAWLETGYDPDPAYGEREIEVEVCEKCGETQTPNGGVCEQCQSPAVPQTLKAAVGRMYVDVVPIFEMFYDASIEDWSKQRAYIREKRQAVDEAKRRWPALADQIQPDVIGSQDSYYNETLVTLGAMIDTRESARRFMQSGARQSANDVSERWYWQMPDATYYGGLLAVIVGGSLMGHAGPLPYGMRMPDGTRRPFLPHLEFPQKLVPGTGFRKTVADDIALLQAARNRWDSICEASGMRMGSPAWLFPNGCNVSGGSGEPGAILRYNASGTPPAKPERIPGQGIPLAFIKRIEMLDKDMEEVAATFEVIKGARPEGVSAGIALQILQERGMSRYGPLFILWEQAWAQWARQALEIFREFATEERLLKIKGRDGEWEVQKFLGADLAGRVDVIPEAGSAMPRSSLTERAEMEQLIATGILNRADPETRFKMLELYGKTHMLPSMAADTKNAIRENEAFDRLAQDPIMAMADASDVEAVRQLDYPSVMAMFRQQFGLKLPPVRPAIDDHAVMSREHAAFLKSQHVERWPEIVLVIAEKHLEYHNQLMIQQMQALQGVQPGGVHPTAGYLARPPARTQVMNTSSSPERLEGDFNEMAADVSAGDGMP